MRQFDIHVDLSMVCVCVFPHLVSVAFIIAMNQFEYGHRILQYFFKNNFEFSAGCYLKKKAHSNQNESHFIGMCRYTFFDLEMSHFGWNIFDELKFGVQESNCCESTDSAALILFLNALS